METHRGRMRASGWLECILAGWLAVGGGVPIVADEPRPTSISSQAAMEWLLSTSEEGDRVRAIQAIRAWNIADRPMLTTLQVLSLRDPSAAVRTAARQAYVEMKPSLSMRRREFAARGAALLREWEWRENVEELDDGAPANGPSESPAPPAAGDEGRTEGESHPAPETGGPEQIVRAHEAPSSQEVRTVAAGEAETAPTAVDLVPLTVEQDAAPPPVSPAVIEKVLRESARNAPAPDGPMAPASTPIPRTEAAPPPDPVRSLDGLGSTRQPVEKPRNSIRIESVAGKPSAAPGAVELPAPRTAEPRIAAAQKPAAPPVDRSEHASPPRVPSTDAPGSNLPTAWAPSTAPETDPEAPVRRQPKSWIAMDQVPRDEAARKQLARELLVKGRQLIQSGRLDEAEDLLFQVRELAVHYRRLEYSPKSLARDIALAREVARRKAVASNDGPAALR